MPAKCIPVLTMRTEDGTHAQLLQAEQWFRETHERLLAEGFMWGGPGALCDCYWKEEPTQKDAADAR